MLSKPLVLFVATVALACTTLEANAQSGSRNAVPAFSAAPSIQAAPAPQLSAPAQYAPAATMQSPAQSVMTQPQSAQPFTSGCTNCQMQSSAVAAPSYSSTTYAAPVTTYSSPTWSTPAYSAPVYSSSSCGSRVYSNPARVYRPVVRSYAPVRRVYRGSCGGYQVSF